MPSTSAGEAVTQTPQSPFIISLDNGVEIRVPVNAYAADILKLIDGYRSFNEIFSTIRDSSDTADETDSFLFDNFEDTYTALTSINRLLVRHETIPPFTPIEKLHQLAN